MSDLSPNAASPAVPLCLCGGDGVRYTVGAARDCPIHGFPTSPADSRECPEDDLPCSECPDYCLATYDTSPDRGQPQ